MADHVNTEGSDLTADGCMPCQGTGRITHLIDASWVPCTACARRRKRLGDAIAAERERIAKLVDAEAETSDRLALVEQSCAQYEVGRQRKAIAEVLRAVAKKIRTEAA